MLAKIRMWVNVRKQGARIDTIPFKELVRLSSDVFRKHKWYFDEDGFLVLEAF